MESMLYQFYYLLGKITLSFYPWEVTSVDFKGADSCMVNTIQYLSMGTVTQTSTVSPGGLHTLT